MNLRVKSLELQLEWPESVPIYMLRSFALEKLREYGAPLRWAITDISPSHRSNGLRQLNIEAVVIIK